MINVLLFKNNNLESEYEKRDERIESFAETLNDAFRQFQKLWNEYKELSEKSKESKDTPANVLKEVNDVAKNANIKYCGYTATAKGNMIPEEDTSKKKVAVAKERKVDCVVATVTTNKQEESSKPRNFQNFHILSQDFSTQSLEEGFVNQSNPPLQEIQNVTPIRGKSPIFGSKKGKTRIASSPVRSPNLSQKSVIILNDFTNEKDPKVVNRSVSSPSLQSNGITISRNPLSSSFQLLSPTPEATITSTPKTIKKWGISTVQNVNTDIIIGTNKKLKQSKLFMTTEKVTDLSSRDDICVNKLEDRNQANETRDVINTNDGIQISDNYLEDSVIQGSPEHEKRLSKRFKRIARRNKSVETLQQKLSMDENVKNRKRVEICEITNNDVHQTDTDVTIFDPKVASTQYTDLPSCSEMLQIEKSVVKDKPGSGENLDLEDEEDYDSNVIDETLFVENVVPSDSWSEHKLDLEKRVKNKKLSVKKFFNVNKKPDVISNDKEIPGLEIDTCMGVSSSEEMKGVSQPRKKLALSNFDVPTKKNTSLTYAYKSNPVRKKAERALLNGWSCLECQKYYEAIGLSEAELAKRKNKCSRHRSKFNEKQISQKDYWNPDFSSSYHSTMWTNDSRQHSET